MQDETRPRRWAGVASRPPWVTMMLVLLLAGWLGSAEAAELRGFKTVVIGPGEIIDDDLYAFAETIDIQGEVRGDVFAFGRTIKVSGLVTGDLMGGGGSTEVSGRIGDSLRRCGTRIDVTGSIADDILAAAGTVVLGPTSRIGRDVLIAADSARLAGSVGKNVEAAVATLTLDGAIEGRVSSDSRTLQLTESARIGGDLSYRSDAAVNWTSENEARVMGEIIRRDDEEAGEALGALVLDSLRLLTPLLALGFLFTVLLPGIDRRTAGSMRRSPWVSLGLGSLMFFVVPIASFLLFTAGLFVGGWWLALVALSIYGVTLLLGLVVAVGFTGSWLLTRLAPWELHRAWGGLLGLFLLAVTIQVPILGVAIFGLSIAFGSGALAWTAWEARPPVAASSTIQLNEELPT